MSTVSPTASLPQSILKRPIIHSKSEGSLGLTPTGRHVLMSEQAERDGDKGAAMSSYDLRVPQGGASNEGDFDRRRSRSAPLSLEASKVARELCRLSDNLHGVYNERRSLRISSQSGNAKSRRHTIGSTTRKVPFNIKKKKESNIEDCDEADNGTAV